MPQTSISDPAVAYAGQNAEPGAPHYFRSATCEGSAAFTIGQPVLRGTEPGSQILPIANSDTVDATTVAGILLLETSRDSNPPVEYDVVPVMRKGVVYMLTSAAVAAGNPVYVGNLTAQLNDVDDATGTGLVVLPGARFLTSAGSGELALVQIDL